MDLMNMFYQRKSGGGSPYNYDLKPLIENFSFYDFIVEGKKRESDDFGGFLVVTPEQYIVGYTAGFGSGSHQSAIGKTMKELKGGGDITNFTDIVTLYTECHTKNICARILYEKVGETENRLPIFNGHLHLIFPHIISVDLLNSFKKFCEDYNEDIGYAIKKSNDTFCISYYLDNVGTIETDNLHDVVSYLESITNYELNEVRDNEPIIGVSTKKELLK